MELIWEYGLNESRLAGARDRIWAAARLTVSLLAWRVSSSFYWNPAVSQICQLKTNPQSRVLLILPLATKYNRWILNAGREFHVHTLMLLIVKSITIGVHQVLTIEAWLCWLGARRLSWPARALSGAGRGLWSFWFMPVHRSSFCPFNFVY
jgi:hypothetical protein